MERKRPHSCRFAYSHNESVLVQFLLQEFLNCCKHLQEIRLLLKKRRMDVGVLKGIGELMERMLGPPREENEFFMWMERNGTMRLFGHYCQLLCEYEKKGQKECEELLRAVTMVLHEYGLGQDLMRQGIKSLSINGQTLAKLLRHLERGNSAFVRLRDLLPDLLYRFRKDENVLFFLLRKHEEIDSYFSQGFTKELLSRFCPKGGIEKAKSYIIARYETRGFMQLSPQISHYIEQLA